ncbi:MAG: hypothetical protein ACK5GZ_02945 [Cyanobium sp.]
MTSEERRDELLRNMIDSGAEIAGGAVGGALGFLAGGPFGAAALGAGGAAAAVAIKRIGGEISERFLGSREKVRTGAVLALAASEIDERINGGESVRDDGFFNQEPDGRSAGGEVVESVLLKSQREPEEQKLPYMAHLLAAISFDSGVSAGMAQQLTKLAEQLTYRQLCLLKVGVCRKMLHLRESDYRGQGSFNRELLQILYECHDLYARGLVNFGGEVALGLADVKPGAMEPQGFGAELFNLMKLSTIPDEEALAIAVILR